MHALQKRVAAAREELGRYADNDPAAIDAMRGRPRCAPTCGRWLRCCALPPALAPGSCRAAPAQACPPGAPAAGDGIKASRESANRWLGGWQLPARPPARLPACLLACLPACLPACLESGTANVCRR
jgi:hypothetical protein